MKPVVGIPLRSDELDDKRSFLYIFDSIKNACIYLNTIPFPIMPPQNLNYYHVKFNDLPDLNDEEKEIVENYLNYIDGLIIPGGFKFSKFDLYLLDEAIKKDMPIFGICLGMQIMSSYKSDIKIDLIESNINHRTDLDQEYAHFINIDKDSKLYEIVKKDKIKVNSFHKRQVYGNSYYDNVAYSEDNVLEAIEKKDALFNIGVQWHPEKMIYYDKDQKKLMDAFVDACKKYKESKIK